MKELVRRQWRQDCRQAAVVGLILLIPVAISRLWLVNFSLRLDETQSIWQASRSIEGILKIIAQDVHVPLYHLLLNVWMQAFGNSALAVRSLSLVFFIASLLVAYAISRLIMSRAWATVALTALAVSPFLNWYANETRMYTMLLFMVLLGQYYFMRLMRYGKGWIGYTVSAVIGMYTHYFFALSLVTQGVFYLLNRKQFPKWSFAKLAGTCLLIAAALAPWAWYFLSQGAAANTKPRLQPPSTVDFFNIYNQFLFGFHGDTANTIIMSCWPLAVVAVFFIVKRRLVLDLHVRYLIAASIVPVVLAFGVSFFVGPFFLSRYLVAAMPSCVLLLVWLASQYRSALSRLAMGCFLVVLLIASALQIASNDTPVKEDYRSVAAYIAVQAQPQDVVALSSPFTIYPIEYYYDGKPQITTIPLWDRSVGGAIPAFSVEKLEAQLASLKGVHQHLYVVLSYDQGYEQAVKSYLDNHLERTQTRRFTSNITLLVYRIGYYTVPALQQHPIK